MGLGAILELRDCLEPLGKVTGERATGRPQKTPYWLPSALRSLPETEPSLPMIAVTCSAAPFTVSVPLSDVPLAVPVKLTACVVPLGSVKVVE